MSQGNQSCLRFSLEESVWFQRGQEVAELVSISLDPNITIQENEQYVSIIGSLELTGEYTCFEQLHEGEEAENSALRFVNSVIEREQGLYEFVHRFPVDITIPRNRFESIEDIDITVDSFDYEFPEKGKLKLTADLAISGLYGEQQHDSQQEGENAPEELEILYRDEAGQAGTASEEFNFPEAPAFSFVEQAEVLKREEDEIEDSLHTPFWAEAKKTGAEDHAAEPEIEFQTVPEYALSDFRSEMESPEMMEEQGSGGTDEQQASPEAESPEAVEESSSSPEETKKKKKKKPNMKKGISIAEFLARKDEAAEVAKIRVCIVQQGETLQLISERYDVPVQQLLKVNNLSLDHEVGEGQVLYVPGAAVNSR